MIPANVFEYVVPANGLIDMVRMLTLLLGMWVFCAALHRFLTHVWFWPAVGYMALGAFTAIQELTVLGDPVYVWRLPLLILMNVAASIHLYGGDHASR